MSIEGRSWFKQFPAELLAGDAVFLTNEEFGSLMRLFFHNWIAETLPDDVEKLAKLVGINKQQFTPIWENISKFFVKVDGKTERLTNPGLAEQEQRRASISAAKAKSGKQGGLAKKANFVANAYPGAKQSDKHPSIREEEKRKETTTTTPLGPLSADQEPENPEIPPEKKGVKASKTKPTTKAPKSNSKTKKRQPSLTPPPTRFKPSESSMKWFKGKYGDVLQYLIDFQTEQFITSSTAKGKIFANWDLAWQTWINNWQTNFGRNPPRENNNSGNKNTGDIKKPWEADDNPNLFEEEENEPGKNKI